MILAASFGRREMARRLSSARPHQRDRAMIMVPDKPVVGERWMGMRFPLVANRNEQGSGRP